MNIEQVRKFAMNLLKDNISARLQEIDAAQGDGTTTPAPTEYYEYPVPVENLMSFPVCFVFSDGMPKRNQDESGVEQRGFQFTIELWYSSWDGAEVQRHIERATAAAGSLLETDDLWAKERLFNPIVEQVQLREGVDNQGNQLRVASMTLEVQGFHLKGGWQIV